MGDTTPQDGHEPPDPVGAPPEHDHAWRRVSAETEYAAAFEYRCDICALTWSM